MLQQNFLRSSNSRPNYALYCSYVEYADRIWELPQFKKEFKSSYVSSIFPFLLTSICDDTNKIRCVGILSVSWRSVLAALFHQWSYFQHRWRSTLIQSCNHCTDHNWPNALLLVDRLSQERLQSQNIARPRTEDLHDNSFILVASIVLKLTQVNCVMK